jgi:hypothetical protein
VSSLSATTDTKELDVNNHIGFSFIILKLNRRELPPQFFGEAVISVFRIFVLDFSLGQN